MPHMDHAEFEALWQKVKNVPLIRRAEARPVPADFSLSGLLDHYMNMAAQQQAAGKLTQPDYNDLQAAVNALKIVLARIKDSELVADAMARNAAAIQARMAKPGNPA
jgi:hypothetical protein